MKQNTHDRIGAFSTGEMMVALAMSSIIMAAAITASVALQKSLAAADAFFATHMQQIRIIDYLSRDVKRATIVSTSADKTTVTCTVPNYVVAAADSEVAVAAANEGARRVPIITTTTGGPRVDYGRRVTDGVLNNGSTTLNSATAKFTAADVGASIWGAGIQSGTTIAARSSATTVTLSKPAKTSPSAVTNVQVSWAGTTTVIYALNNQTIERRENGAVTTIASSTDQLIPETTDVEQANTEYAASTVTFLPVFTFNSHAAGQTQGQKDKENAKRKGTTVFAKAYLRNKRRG